MLVWIENAPEFDEDSNNMVTAFIDNIITCEKRNNNSEFLELVNRLVDRHSHHVTRNLKLNVDSIILGYYEFLAELQLTEESY